MEKCAAFDGDADRLIYFYKNTENKLKVIDGDKQMAFIAKYIRSLLLEIGKQDVSMVHVLTAYANSKALKYLDANSVKWELCKTGVKNAHPIAEQYVIGCNSEANGHATLTCKFDTLKELLKEIDDTNIAKQKILAAVNLSNFLVGDAMANLLLIEAILFDLDMTAKDLSDCFEENPSKNFKLVVKDRTKFIPIHDESRLQSPEALQQFID